MKHRPLTESIVCNARRLHRLGIPSATLARDFEVSRSELESALSGRTWKRAPVSAPTGTRGRPRRMDDQDIVDAHRLSAAGHSVREIAARIGLSRSVVHRALRLESGGRLNPLIVRVARARYAAGETMASLSRRFHIQYVTMRLAVLGGTWRDVQ